MAKNVINIGLVILTATAKLIANAITAENVKAIASDCTAHNDRMSIKGQIAKATGQAGKDINLGHYSRVWVNRRPVGFIYKGSGKAKITNVDMFACEKLLQDLPGVKLLAEPQKRRGYDIQVGDKLATLTCLNAGSDYQEPQPAQVVKLLATEAASSK